MIMQPHKSVLNDPHWPSDIDLKVFGQRSRRIGDSVRSWHADYVVQRGRKLLMAQYQLGDDKVIDLLCRQLIIVRCLDLNVMPLLILQHERF